jgi:hypothetical protein
MRVARLAPGSAWLVLAASLGAPAAVRAAAWQYHLAFEETADKAGAARKNTVSLWMPPEREAVRALFISQTLGIEAELQADPEVRKACAACGVAVVRFAGLSGTFEFWRDGNRDGERLLRALDLLARASGHPEIARVPWITAGHSTHGIFCRNVAYWKPDRVAAVVHIKSGNFHQASCLPPRGGLAGIPLIAINGQLETYGPESGIDPAWGRETQWIYVRKDIEAFRRRDPRHLMSIAVHPGEDHFHGAPELGSLVACFLRKTAQYRLPDRLPPGDGPIKPLDVKPEDGWLTDSDLHDPKHPPAPDAQYAGDKAKAMWHYDRDMAEAVTAFHRNLAKHQVIDNPTGAWLDADDGWTFKVRADWLAAWPEKFGGANAGKPVGHAETPFVFRCKAVEPVRQVGPDTFRLLRPVRGKRGGVNIAAFHPGDATYRATSRWGAIPIPAVKGTKQTIAFPDIPDLKAGAGAIELQAKAGSGLPVYYEVDYGPVSVEGGTLRISDLPARPRYPIDCKVTAFQLGRRVGVAVEPAEDVSRTFRIVAP